MAPRMRTESVCAALQLAIAQRHPAPELIVHSNRESPYASAPHQGLLAHHPFICSMSRKGRLMANAVMKRFLQNRKTERVLCSLDARFDPLVGRLRGSNCGEISRVAFALAVFAPAQALVVRRTLVTKLPVGRQFCPRRGHGAIS